MHFLIAGLQLPVWLQVVPGRAGGGSFKRKKNYIAKKEFAYRMCARWPTIAMSKLFFSVWTKLLPLHGCDVMRFGVMCLWFDLLSNDVASCEVICGTTPTYYSVLCTTKYYSSTTLYYKVLLQYYSVLQSTTPVLLQYYSVLLQYYSVLQSTTPVLLCTITYYSSTTLYYKVLRQYYNILLQYYSVLQSTTPVLQRTTPVLLCTTKYYASTTKYYSSTTPVLLCTTKYYNVLPSTIMYYSVLQSTTPVLLCTTKNYNVLLQY